MISVIITTYGDPTALKRAIESVLYQTYTNIEIIVVDDNSPESVNREKTEDIMRNFQDDIRIKYIKHKKNKNGAAARNTGIKVAKGNYIAFLDNDDFFMPNKLEKCMELIEKESNINIILTNVLVIRNNIINSMLDFSEQCYTSFDLMKNVNILGTGSNLFLTKQLCVDLDGFDETFIRHQDIEFMVRALEVGNLKVIPEFLTVKVHTGNNIPNYNNLKKVKKQFTDKYKYILENQNQKERELYYKSMASNLFDVAIASGNREDISKAVQYLQKFGNISLKQRIFAISPKLREFIYKLKLKRKPDEFRFRYNRELSDEDRKYIEKMIVFGEKKV